jgi:hypothetical protein
LLLLSQREAAYGQLLHRKYFQLDKRNPAQGREQPAKPVTASARKKRSTQLMADALKGILPQIDPGRKELTGMIRVS